MFSKWSGTCGWISPAICQQGAAVSARLPRGSVMRLRYDTLLTVTAVSILPAAHFGRRSPTHACLADAAAWVEDQPWEEVDEVLGGVIMDVNEGIDPSTGAEASDDVAALLKAANLPDAQVSLTLCNDEAITELNCQWRGKDRPTDVLSFPLEDEVMLGDIVISVETAAQQAASRGHSLRDEVRVLMVHGMLHLLGREPRLRARPVGSGRRRSSGRWAEAGQGMGRPLAPVEASLTEPPWRLHDRYDHELGAEDEAEMAAAEQKLLRKLSWRGDGLVHIKTAAEA